MQLKYQGVDYLLHANASVRQSEEELPKSREPFQSIETDDADATRAVCESILDLESNQKSMRCEVGLRFHTSSTSVLMQPTIR